MTQLDWTINIAGAVLVLAIIWWFWLSSPKALKTTSRVINILVDGGSYTPNRIQVKKGQEVSLVFLRKDANPCAEKVIFSALDVSADLPLGQEVKLNLKLAESGEYEFTCQMGMYRGVLLVT